MSRKTLVAAIAALALVVAGPAHAITYGYRDYNLHPNVGAMAQDTRGTGELRQVCSGTLISPTVYLTAAHCTDYLFSLGFSTAFVTFDTDFDRGVRSSTRARCISTRRTPGTPTTPTTSRSSCSRERSRG